MKSLASISPKDIDTIKMALNDAISDINMELRNSMSEKKRMEVMDYKTKYVRVYDKLRHNPSIYSLAEHELDIAAGGFKHAIETLEENPPQDLDEQERYEINSYKKEGPKLIGIPAHRPTRVPPDAKN